jgi:mRNA interferase RelE/StbE
MYQVLVKKSVEKQLLQIPSVYYKSIRKKIDDLSENPRPQGFHKLEGFENKYRVRFGIYRILYSIKDDILIVEVINIGHRSNVYRNI